MMRLVLFEEGKKEKRESFILRLHWNFLCKQMQKQWTEIYRVIASKRHVYMCIQKKIYGCKKKGRTEKKNEIDDHFQLLGGQSAQTNTE